jgi:hypothetical protein
MKQWRTHSIIPDLYLLFLYAVDGLILNGCISNNLTHRIICASPFSFDIGISPWQEWSDYLNFQCSLSTSSGAEHPAVSTEYILIISNSTITVQIYRR